MLPCLIGTRPARVVLCSSLLHDPATVRLDPRRAAVVDGADLLFDRGACTGVDGELVVQGESLDLGDFTGLDIPFGAGAGAWATSRIIEVGEDGTLLVEDRPDTGGGHRVCQRLPNYRDVDLTAGVLTSTAWDGSGGGIVALRARERLSIDGDSRVDVSGLGLRGGSGGGGAGRLKVLADDVNGVPATDAGFADEVDRWTSVPVGATGPWPSRHSAPGQVCSVEPAAPGGWVAWTGFTVEEDIVAGEAR
jgi:hypothetical protein